MARGTSGASEREAFWRGHVAAWQGSGESIRGYCLILGAIRGLDYASDMG